LINAFGSDANLYDVASPQYHIQQGKYLPYLHLIHQNTSDRLYSHYRFRDSLIANGHNNHSLFNANPYNHESIALMIGNQNDSVNVTGSVMTFFRNCLGNISKSIQDIKNPYLQMLIYPNPTQNKLTISNLPASFNGRVIIYNSMGQLIQSEHKSGSQFSIQTQYLTSGVYLVQFRNENGEVFINKFIKE